MIDDDARARALDRLLERGREARPVSASGSGPASGRTVANESAADPGRSESRAPDTSAQDSTAHPELAELVELAAALGRFELPAPDADFRLALAERLADAPWRSTAVARQKQPAAGVGSAADGVPPAPVSPTRGPDGILQAVQALGDWLDRPTKDRPSAEALPGEAPELAALARALEHMPRPAGATPEFRRSLARRLLHAPLPQAARGPRVGEPLERRQARRGGFFFAASAAAVVLFLVAGAAMASAGALPGSPLYSIKRGAESARLLLAESEAAVDLHTSFADRRLDEAVAVPDRSGALLADFSREATAALAAADRAVEGGRDRGHVAAPLLAWFKTARGGLLEGRPVLPAMAWRAALALVDEAIRALGSDRPFAAAAVPRLADYHDLLARRAEGRASGIAVLRHRQPIARTSRTRPPAAVPPLPQYVVLAPVGADPRPIADGTAGGSSTDPGLGGGSPTPPSRPARPTQRTAPTSEPARTEPPATKAPGVTPPSATEPAPPVEPTSVPPTTVPVDPVTPTWPAPETPAPLTPTTTPEPGVTPTWPVINKPPTIVDMHCDHPVIELFGSTACHVSAVDPEGAPLYYLWLADAPQMVNDRQKDAIYYAAWGIGGGKMRVGIVVYVSDRESFRIDDPDVASAETQVEVRSLDAASVP